MIYKEIKGNLLDLFDAREFNAIAHGANCFNRMKSGIAGQIAEKYPGVVEADNKTGWGDIKKLGDFSYYDVPGAGRIYNCYTQYRYGRTTNFVYLDYDALARSLRKISDNLLQKLGVIGHIGLPQIGCGLGQGDWSMVKQIIKENIREHKITIVIWSYPGY